MMTPARMVIEFKRRGLSEHDALWKTIMAQRPMITSTTSKGTVSVPEKQDMPEDQYWDQVKRDLPLVREEMDKLREEQDP